MSLLMRSDAPPDAEAVADEVIASSISQPLTSALPSALAAEQPSPYEKWYRPGTDFG